MITIVLFLVGFVLLIKGADSMVTGASALAQRLGISALVIGLTIVAFGTSAPELVVNLLASLDGNTDIAIGNIVGSNIANILLILGAAATIYPLTVQKGTVWKEIPFALLAILVLFIMASDVALSGATESALTRGDGLVLISFFIIFMYYIFGVAKQTPTQEDNAEEPSLNLSYKRSGVMIVGGLVALVIGGKWIVDGAVTFATMLGVSQSLIGLTVVAVGTSLPELATSVVAALKKQSDIAVGNVVGSNIFNVFWILGISAVLSPLPFADALRFDVLVAVLVTFALFLALFVGKRHTLDRWQGICFILLYVAYTVFLVFRG